MALELTSLTLVQNYLGDATLTSGTMNAYMNAAEAMIARHCGRYDNSGSHWLSASHTEYLNGRMDPGLQLTFTPVKGLTSVERIESASTDTDYTLTDLEVDGIAVASLSTSVYGTAGILHMRYASGRAMSLSAFANGEPYPSMFGRLGEAYPNFGDGHRRIKVVYTGGYTAAPADLALAATIWASTLYRRRSINPTVQSETLGRYSYTNADPSKMESMAVPPDVRALIDPYRKVL
jgi:hypothetical protein